MNTEITNNTSNEIKKDHAPAPVTVAFAFNVYVMEREAISLNCGKVLRAVANVCDRAGLSTLRLKEVGLKTVARFKEYCANEYKDSTATAYLSNFLAFLRWCIDQGSPIDPNIIPSQYKESRKRRAVPLRGLTPEELDLIRSYKPNTQRMANVKSWLLLACSTGMRVVDMNQVATGRIVRTVLGSELRILETSTTVEQRRFLLSKDSLNTCREVMAGNIPPLTAGKVANLFRELCKRAGINNVEGITSKVGAYTCSPRMFMH